MNLSIIPRFDISYNKQNIIKSNKIKNGFYKNLCYIFQTKNWEKNGYYLYICGSSWIIFIVFELSIKHLCHHIDEFEELNYEIYHSMNLISFGTFLMLWFSLFYKLICVYKEKHTKTFIAIFILFNVMSQSLLAEVLIVSNNSPVCIDYFGVVSESSIWGEWLAATPMIIFYTLSIANENNLTKIDITIIVSLFLSIFFGFLLNIKNKYSAILCLSLAYIFSIPGVGLPIYFYLNYYSKKISPNKKYSYDEKNADELIHIGFKLSLFIMTYIVVYGIVYLLAFNNVINQTITLVIFQIITIITKNFYYEICLEDTITIIDKLETRFLEESKEHNARRDYFKGIIKEIYNPLNSLVLGIDLLNNKFEEKYFEEMDIINSIKNAVNDLSSTINDVKMVQLIENETLKLNYERYSITDLINEIKIKINNIFDNIDVKFKINLSDDVNSLNLISDIKYIFLDAKYIKHVIVSIIYFINKNINLLDNQILIKININDDNNDESNNSNKQVFHFFNRSNSGNDLNNPLLNYLTFSIIYNGDKIDNNANIFDRFSYNKNSNKDIILDLYLCKKIIILHGGYIWIKTNGSNSFIFSIPITTNEPNNYSNKFNEIIKIKNDITNIKKINNIILNIENDISNNNIKNKGNILIINSLDRLLEKFIKNQDYYCDVIEDFDIEKDDNKVVECSKYSCIIIYHSSKFCNILEICRFFRKKMYLNIIIVITFDLEINYNSYINAGANIVFFYPIKPRELKLLLS